MAMDGEGNLAICHVGMGSVWLLAGSAGRLRARPAPPRDDNAAMRPDGGHFSSPKRDRDDLQARLDTPGLTLLTSIEKPSDAAPRGQGRADHRAGTGSPRTAILFAARGPRGDRRDRRAAGERPRISPGRERSRSPTDVTEPDSIARAIKNAVGHFGRLDVCNARRLDGRRRHRRSKRRSTSLARYQADLYGTFLAAASASRADQISGARSSTCRRMSR